MDNTSTLVKDANGEVIPQQYYDEASQTYKVAANGDTTGIDFSKKALLKDANFRVIPSQYYDVDRGEFVVGVLSGGGGSEGDEAATVFWGDVLNKPQTFPPEDHTHDDRYNTKAEVQDAIDYVRQSMMNAQGLVAVNSDDQPDYLANKVDNVTIAVEGSEVKVKSVDGLAIGTAQLNTWLSGTEANLQSQINALNDTLATVTAGMRFIGKFELKSELDAVANKNNGDLAVVLADETRIDARTMYVYNESLGMWDFVGAFEFSDEFLALKDTPNSYNGADGKVLKVDESNNKIVFSDVDYSDIKNRPSSTITQIDSAVSKAHDHANKDSLDGIGVSTNGVLTYNGEEYIRKKDLPISVDTQGNLIVNNQIYVPKKQHLYARRASSEQSIGLGSALIYNSKINGDITLDASTGAFTLQAGKTYRITATFYLSLTTFVHIYLADAATMSAPPETKSRTTLEATNANYTSACSGVLDVIITPTTTRQFLLRTDGTVGDDAAKFKQNSSTLIIQEL